MMMASISSSNCSINPPPMTITSGLNTLIKFATAMPVYSAASSMMCSTNLSPRLIAFRRSPLRKSSRSGPNISVRIVFWPSLTASLILRKMAVRLASASKQPLLPQPHFGPPTSSTMCPISPAVRLNPEYNSLQDQPAADARAEKDADDVARFRFQFNFVNSQRAHIAVVLQEDLRIELLLQFLLQRDIVPAEIGRENDLAGFRIHRSRRADADGADFLEIEVAFVHRLADATGDASDHFVRA